MRCKVARYVTLLVFNRLKIPNKREILYKKFFNTGHDDIALLLQLFTHEIIDITLDISVIVPTFRVSSSNHQAAILKFKA